MAHFRFSSLPQRWPLRKVKVGRVFILVKGDLINDWNLEAGNLTEAIFLAECVEDHLVCLTCDGQHPGVRAEMNQSEVR